MQHSVTHTNASCFECRASSKIVCHAALSPHYTYSLVKSRLSTCISQTHPSPTKYVATTLPALTTPLLRVAHAHELHTRQARFVLARRRVARDEQVIRRQCQRARRTTRRALNDHDDMCTRTHVRLVLVCMRTLDVDRRQIPPQQRHRHCHASRHTSRRDWSPRSVSHPPLASLAAALDAADAAAPDDASRVTAAAVLADADGAPSPAYTVDLVCSSSM
jgi:hypothetical protein